MTKKERKETARVFYGAAELIATESDCCCNAIDMASKDFPNSEMAIALFEKLFARDALRFSSHKILSWFEEKDESMFMPEVRSRRILGLCLAAYLVETGEIG
jgi:hypothetical protein